MENYTVIFLIFKAISEEVLKDSKTYRGQFHGLQCDISDEKNIKDTFQKIKSTIGLIHILVNNAGVATPNDRGFQSTSLILIIL